MNVFLIGYRCTGKTTVGKSLADRLGWPFVDTDRVIVENSGISIARMVESHGWPFFREREYKALQMVCDQKHQIVATGGGIVLDTRNISAMKQSGTAVWLTASEKTIAARILADEATKDSRPPLTGRGLTAEIASVLSERKHLYEKAADLVINTDGEEIAAICDRIMGNLGITEFRD